MIFKPQPLQPVSRLFHYKDYLTSNKSIYWDYRTYGEQVETDLNKGCYNMDKNKLHAIHNEVLGYSAKIDPETFKGTYIEKSIHQGRHDAVICTENQSPKADKVYERYLDNSIEYRYFYHKNFPFVVKKTRQKGDFSMGFESAELWKFTDKQNEQIKLFCEAYGIDFAELDVIIYRKKIYIIDVNNMAGNGLFFQKFKDGEACEKLYIKQLQNL